MNDTRAFAPFYKVSRTGQTGTLYPSITVAATAASANQSGVIPGVYNGGANQMQIANTSTSSWAYVNFGVIQDSSTVPLATVAASFPVPPGSAKVVTVDSEVNAASVIMGAGAAQANVTFTRGQGIG